jgi:hypothetical protein
MKGTHFEKATSLTPNFEEQSTGNFGAFRVALLVFVEVEIPYVHLLPKRKMEFLCTNPRK